jgi:hypothetical protein
VIFAIHSIFAAVGFRQFNPLLSELIIFLCLLSGIWQLILTGRQIYQSSSINQFKELIFFPCKKSTYLLNVKTREVEGVKSLLDSYSTLNKAVQIFPSCTNTKSKTPPESPSRG